MSLIFACTRDISPDTERPSPVPRRYGPRSTRRPPSETTVPRGSLPRISGVTRLAFSARAGVPHNGIVALAYRDLDRARPRGQCHLEVVSLCVYPSGGAEGWLLRTNDVLRAAGIHRLRLGWKVQVRGGKIHRLVIYPPPNNSPDYVAWCDALGDELDAAGARRVDAISGTISGPGLRPVGHAGPDHDRAFLPQPGGCVQTVPYGQSTWSARPRMPGGLDVSAPSPALVNFNSAPAGTESGLSGSPSSQVSSDPKKQT